jgi:hypothetical protein
MNVTPLSDFNFNAVEDMVNNQSYVPKQIIVKMLSDNISLFDPQLAAAWKTIIEIHPIEVSGFNNDFDRNTGRLNNKCLRPAFTLNEKYGKAVTMAVGRLFSLTEKIISSPSAKHNGSYLFKFIAIEPDATGTKVVDAWICSVEGILDFSGPSSMSIRSVDTDISKEIQRCHIELDCTTKYLSRSFTTDGNEVLEEAQKILDELSVASANPQTKDGFAKSLEGSLSFGLDTALNYANRVAQSNIDYLNEQAASQHQQPDLDKS